LIRLPEMKRNSKQKLMFTYVSQFFAKPMLAVGLLTLNIFSDKLS